MLTIREALQMPIFANARLVAGEKGLENAIRWVHIVDIPDARFEWTKGGELLLTAGFGLKGDPDRQKELIPELARKGLSGIVLSAGHYLEQTPPTMRAAADELGFPIIETPAAVPFIEITEAIFGQIVNRQYALQQRSEQIHRSLTDLVLEGGTLQDVADELAALLQRSVTVESEAFEVLASSKAGPVDRARSQSVARGQTSPEVARSLLDDGIYDRLLRERRSIRIEPMPELGMTMERIVAPIIVAREIMGYIWLIAGSRELTELDELAIDNAATVSALIMLKDEAVRKAELSLRGDLLDQILRVSGPPPAELSERAHQFGFHLHDSHQVLAVQASPKAAQRPVSLLRRVEEWLKAEDVAALVVPREERLVVVLESSGSPYGVELAQSMLRALQQPAQPLRIGVGEAAQGLEGLGASYDQANEALEISVLIGEEHGVRSFSDLGLLHWLYHLPRQAQPGNRFLEVIHHLAEHDIEHETDLLPTLSSFLRHGAVSAEAAQALNIHRNTLRYRLDQIQQTTGLDLKDPLTRLNLHVALESYRLKNRT